jgi:hypothetical protein
LSAKAIHPVYVDGPLKGQDFPVPAASRHVQAVDPEDYRPALAGGDGLLHPVTYALQRFGFHSGGSTVMLWLGCSEPGEPDVAVLADLLLSDAAKAARCD